MKHEKYREFWIEPLSPGDDIVHRSDDNLEYKAPEQIIHVVEMSYARSLEEEIVGLRVCLNMNKRITDMGIENEEKLELEIERLKAELNRYKDMENDIEKISRGIK